MASFWAHYGQPSLSRTPALNPATHAQLAKESLENTFDDLYSLRKHLFEEKIIDSTGLVLKSTEIDATLPKESLIRLEELLNAPFALYTKDRENSFLVGQTTPRNFIKNLSHLPISLVGSAVWHVLGIEFITQCLKKYNIFLTQNAKNEIIKFIHHNDVDLRGKWLKTPAAYNMCGTLLAMSLKESLESDFFRRPGVREHLRTEEQKLNFVRQNLFVKDSPIIPNSDDAHVYGAGHREGYRVEVSAAKAALPREELTSIDAVSILNVQTVNSTSEVVSSFGPIEQSVFDFILRILRLRSYQTVGDLGTARCISYLHQNFESADPCLLDNLIPLLLANRPPKKDLSFFLYDLFNKTILNHLRGTPNGIVNLAFKASYSLAKYLTKEQFIAFWKFAYAANFQSSPSYMENELLNICDNFSKGLLAPLPLFHFLSLSKASLIKRIVPDLTFEELAKYCDNLDPLKLVHKQLKSDRSRFVSKDVEDLVFEAIRCSPHAVALWKKFERHLTDEKRALFASLLPALQDEIKAEKLAAEIEHKVAIAAAAVAVPKTVRRARAKRAEKLAVSPARTVTVAPSPSMPIQQAKPILEVALPVAPVVEKVALPILQAPLEETKVILASETTAPVVPQVVVLSLRQLKGDEPEFQRLFDEEANECHATVKANPAKNGSKIIELLEFAKAHAHHLGSHNTLAKLLLLKTTLKDKSKEIYLLDFEKISDPKKRLEVLHQLNLLKYPHGKFDLSSTLDALSFDIASDRWLRTLLKDRKNISVSISALYRWLDKNKIALSTYPSDIKQWVATLLSNELLIPHKLIQSFVLSLFNIASISSIEINQLRARTFKTEQNLLEFYQGFSARSDKSALTFRFEALKAMSDSKFVSQELASFNTTHADELLNLIPLTLLDPFNADQKSLQNYTDILLTTCTKKLKADLSKSQPIALELHKFVRNYAPLLTDHTQYAEFLCALCKLKKATPKESTSLDCSKIANHSLRLDVVHQLETLAIPYESASFVLALDEIPCSIENDEKLRALILVSKKAPCNKEDILKWIDQLIGLQKVKELKKWLSVLHTTLPDLLIAEKTMLKMFFKLLEETSFDIKEIVLMKKSLGLSSEEQLMPLFHHLLRRKDSESLPLLKEVLFEINQDVLWVEAFHARICFEMISFLDDFDKLSPHIQERLFIAILRNSSTFSADENAKLVGKFTSLRPALRALPLETTHLYVEWLLLFAQPSSLYMATQVMMEMKPPLSRGAPLIARWTGEMILCPNKEGLKDIVDQALTTLDLAINEKILLYASFNQHDKLLALLSSQLCQLNLETKKFVLSILALPRIDILDLCITHVFDPEFQNYLGDDWENFYCDWLLKSINAFADETSPELLMAALERFVALYWQVNGSHELDRPELFVALSNLTGAVAGTTQHVEQLYKLILDLIYIFHLHSQSSPEMPKHLMHADKKYKVFKPEVVTSPTLALPVHRLLDTLSRKTLANKILALCSILLETRIFHAPTASMISRFVPAHLEMLSEHKDVLPGFYPVADLYFRFVALEETSLIDEHRENSLKLLAFFKRSSPDAYIAKWHQYFESDCADNAKVLACNALVMRYHEKKPEGILAKAKVWNQIFDILKEAKVTSGPYYKTIFDKLFYDELMIIEGMEQDLKTTRENLVTIIRKQRDYEERKTIVHEALRNFVEFMFSIPSPNQELLRFIYQTLLVVVPRNVYHEHEGKYFEKIQNAMLNCDHWLELQEDLNYLDPITNLLVLKTYREFPVISIVDKILVRTAGPMIDAVSHQQRGQLAVNWIIQLIERQDTQRLVKINEYFNRYSGVTIWQSLPQEKLVEDLLNAYFQPTKKKPKGRRKK